MQINPNLDGLGSVLKNEEVQKSVVTSGAKNVIAVTELKSGLSNRRNFTPVKNDGRLIGLSSEESSI